MSLTAKPFDITNPCWDAVHDSLYDSVSYYKGQHIKSHTLFSVPIGQQGKTLLDTNMEMSHTLPLPMHHEIKRILFTFPGTCNKRSVLEVAENVWFELWIGQKRYAQAVIITLPCVITPDAPLKVCDFCKSVFCNNSRCPNCGAQQFTLHTLGKEHPEYHHDSGSHQFWLDLLIPLPIMQQQYFSVKLYGDYTTSDTVRMWCHLEGILYRGIS